MSIESLVSVAAAASASTNGCVERGRAGRRAVLRAWLATAVGALAAACRAAPGGDQRSTVHGALADEGRIRGRPRRAGVPPSDGVRPGLQPLGIDAVRDALLYVPAGYRADRPAPLVVLLHGAGGNAEGGIRLLRDHADDAGCLLLAPASRAGTWEAVFRRWGTDSLFVDVALQHVFARCAVDADRLALGGFSDGASYALSLGLTNGDLFTHVIAFSPGFMTTAARRGLPRVYVSHGARDEVLPVDLSRRRLVPALKRDGYAVHYHEFDGAHGVPREVRAEAVAWFTEGR